MTHDAIRKHLLEEVFGIFEQVERLPDLEELKQTEYCDEFDELRRNRMVMGAFRYGRLSNPDKWKYNFIEGLRKKLWAYVDTGNTENLVDAANYLMLEFMQPSHPNAHFRAEDNTNHCPERK